MYPVVVWAAYVSWFFLLLGSTDGHHHLQIYDVTYNLQLRTVLLYGVLLLSRISTCWMPSGSVWLTNQNQQTSVQLICAKKETFTYITMVSYCSHKIANILLHPIILGRLTRWFGGSQYSAIEDGTCCITPSNVSLLERLVRCKWLFTSVDEF